MWQKCLTNNLQKSKLRLCLPMSLMTDQGECLLGAKWHLQQHYSAAYSNICHTDCSKCAPWQPDVGEKIQVNKVFFLLK